MKLDRRTWFGLGAAGLVGVDAARAEGPPASRGLTGRDLTITRVTVTPIALPDPPLLMSGGCHGPYFLRNIIEIETADGVSGLGETKGSEIVTDALRQAAKLVVGHSATAYRKFAAEVCAIGNSVYSGFETACLDAIGRATGMRLCELLGGPVREEVEFASYLFYRYAADDARILDDARIVDGRGRGAKALDDFGEVRTAEAMADLAVEFQRRYGFRVHKLKAGVLPPEVELETLRQMAARLGDGHLLRIDPNARWSVETAIKFGEQMKSLPLEYYEDPVEGQQAMAVVREKVGLPMSTNMCVTEFAHIPPAVVSKPIDVVLCDHHGWGGITACQALGPIATSLGWRVSQHSNNHSGVTMAAMIHVGAVVPELTVASDTHYPWLIDGADVIEGGKLKIAGGKLRVPTGPGLGVDLDRDALARANETYEKCGMRERNDAATMERVEPGWKRELW